MLFDKTKKKYVQDIKNLTKKFYNRFFQHALGAVGKVIKKLTDNRKVGARTDAL